MATTEEISKFVYNLRSEKNSYITKQIVSMIKKLSSSYTIIIVEHDMNVIYSVAKEIYVLDQLAEKL